MKTKIKLEQKVIEDLDNRIELRYKEIDKLKNAKKEFKISQLKNKMEEIAFRLLEIKEKGLAPKCIVASSELYDRLCSFWDKLPPFVGLPSLSILLMDNNVDLDITASTKFKGLRVFRNWSLDDLEYYIGV